MDLILDTPDRICYNTDMNRIEQTTLSIEDINEHNFRLVTAGCANEQDTVAKRKTTYDDMLERFIHTFLESLEL